MSKRVDLYYDIVSPYTWIGFELLCRYRLAWGLPRPALRPVLLGALLKGSGNRLPGPVSPAKAAYTVRLDLPRLARHYGLPMRIAPDGSGRDAWLHEAMFRKGTLATMRFVTAVQLQLLGQGDGEDGDAAVEQLSRQLFLRLFSRRLDVTEPASLRQAALDAGLAAATAEAALAELADGGGEAAKARLRATTEEALALGAFGSPTFAVHTGDGGGVEGRRTEMVFGSDRFHVIADLLGFEYLGPLKHLSQTPMS